MNQKTLFFHDKTVRLLIELNRLGTTNVCIFKLARIINTEYSHAHKTLQKFESLDLVYSVKTGRKRNYYITETGKCIAGHITKIINTLKKKGEINANVDDCP